MNHADPETAADPAPRIAMWSGPRTVSTALMRAWENRPDTVVADEPLYAFYLDRTGLDHPGRAEVIASQPTDWRVVLARLTNAPLPAGAVIGYAKHMTHHLLPEVDRTALAPFRHAHLIRDPRELLASYARVRTEPTLADLGLAQQAEIFEAFGGPVVDSRDLLADPEGILRALCQALDVPFDDRMLAWPPGPRDTDGVWAPHWYESVRSSTGFTAYRPPTNPLPAHLEPLAESARPTTRACTTTVLPARAENTSEPKGRRCRLDAGATKERRGPAAAGGQASKAAPKGRPGGARGDRAPEASEKEKSCCRSSMSATATSSSTWEAGSRTATRPW